MLGRLMRATRALVLPVWLPYAVGALGVAVLGVYGNHVVEAAKEAARVEERNANLAEIAKAKDAAQKHFEERARTIAAAVAALKSDHAAELERRDALEDALTNQWAEEVKKSASLATSVCWPLATVKELRK